MTAQRIPLAEMTAVAHDQGLEVEFDNAAGLAFLWVGRREYVATVPPVTEAASAPDGAS